VRTAVLNSATSKEMEFYKAVKKNEVGDLQNKKFLREKHGEQ
jgi:uncharacterized protein YdaT